MTHIRGDITKVKEVLSKGYKQPIVQTTRGYTINTGAIGAITVTYALPNITSGKTAYVKKLSATCNDFTNTHYVNLTRIDVNGVANVFFESYFYEGYEWDIGDVAIADNETWTASITNIVAGTTFTINIYWVEN